MRPKPVRPASKLQLQQLQQQLWPAASVFEMASRPLEAELVLGGRTAGPRITLVEIDAPETGAPALEAAASAAAAAATLARCLCF
jgi:hypothetical protein